MGDVANAVLDGTDCVMLSGETVNGESLYQAVRNSTLRKYGHLSTSESIASSAVKTAIDVNAKAIIVMSESGNTARQVAKFRPGMPIKVITTSKRVACQCFGTLKGSTGHLVATMDDEDTMVKLIIDEMKAAGKTSAGDPYVIVHGTVAKSGATNTMKIEYV